MTKTYLCSVGIGGRWNWCWLLQHWHWWLLMLVLVIIGGGVGSCLAVLRESEWVCQGCVQRGHSHGCCVSWQYCNLLWLINNLMINHSPWQQALIQF